MNYLITIVPISFGPCCLGAELLQALELRTCSYGFDWSRSGSLEHKDFLKQGSSEFFKTRHESCYEIKTGIVTTQIAYEDGRNRRIKTYLRLFIYI